MPVTDKSGNGVVPNVGSGARPGWVTASANGSAPSIPWGGGEGVLLVSGTFGGGNVTLNAAYRGPSPGTPITVPMQLYVGGVLVANVAANGAYNFEAGACELIPVIAGATSPSLSIGVTMSDDD